jgi:hypothetical protein
LQAPVPVAENEEPKYSGADIGLEFEEVLKKAAAKDED